MASGRPTEGESRKPRTITAFGFLLAGGKARAKPSVSGRGPLINAGHLVPPGTIGDIA